MVCFLLLNMPIRRLYFLCISKPGKIYLKTNFSLLGLYQIAEHTLCGVIRLLSV